MVSTCDFGEGEPKHRLALAVLSMSLAVALSATGCFTSGSLDPGGTSRRPLDDRAVSAQALPYPAATATATTPAAMTTPATAMKARPHRPAARARTGRAARDTAADGGEPVQWHKVLEVSDPPGDTGPAEARPYADLTALRIEDGGDRGRLTVMMAGGVPKRLTDGEVVGVGIDVFRTNTRESDYQVFLDGGADGWRAFLQTPQGFVRFPANWGISGRQLIIELPWSSIGGRTAGQASAFSDWSTNGTLNPSSRDSIPDTGTHRFTV